MFVERTTSEAKRRRGAVLVKILICLTILVGMLALNLDGGRMMDERRRAQAVADSAALAAGADLYSNYWTWQGADTPGTARAAALNVAAAHGYPASAVTVNIPPLSGTFAGQAGYAEVIIDSTLDATFSKIFSGNGLEVSARAVARGEPMPIGIILLRPSGADSFLNTALAFALVNKPLIVNSNDPAAFHQASVGVLVAGRVDVTGGASITSGLLNVSRVWTNVRPTPDPLAFLPVPDASSATVRSATPLTINTLAPRILQPGVYRGGIHITGASIVVMNPGVYIMEGGGFQVDGLATVTSLETMVYNTTDSIYAAGPISVTALGKVVMTAPLSGTYQGLNFFQNRAMTNTFTVNGLGLTTITGTVYAAKAHVDLTGSAAVGLDILGGAYVVDSMTVGGVGAVTINLGLNPPRVPDVRVVE
jgi:hypothetical protein